MAINKKLANYLAERKKSDTYWAEFTASVVGKIFANSGLSNTRLLPFLKAA